MNVCGGLFRAPQRPRNKVRGEREKTSTLWREMNGLELLYSEYFEYGGYCASKYYGTPDRIRAALE